MNRRISDLTLADVLVIVVVVGILTLFVFSVRSADRRAQHAKSYAQCVENWQPNCKP